MEKLLLIMGLCLFMVDCSNQAVITDDVLANVADMNLQQSFELTDEKSVGMYLEVYENGKLNKEKTLSFGKPATGQGIFQLSAILLDNGKNELLFIGGIQDEQATASMKAIVEMPSLSWISSESKSDVLKENGETVLGTIGFFEGDTAPSLLSDVTERGDFVEAYEPFSTLYVVVVEIR